MARFPYYKKNAKELGKVLAKARLDQSFRRHLMENPKSALQEVGLPDCAQELMNFEIVDGANQNAVVLPFRLNQSKLDHNDPGYLQGLAQSFSKAN